MTNWNTPNIPPIKTEPREASPQPFNLYRAPSEMTPSPQPMSPSTTYKQNASSPYNITVSGNTPLVSPSHQYQGSTAGGGGGVGLLNTDSTPAQLEIHNEYNVYGGEQQQQQQHQQHLQQSHLSRHYVRQNQLPPQNEPPRQPHHQQQQQQFHGILYDNADVANWEEKFASVVANVSNASEAAMNNLNNNNNQFNMQNLLTATAASVTGVSQHPQWNFPPNNVQDAQLQQQHHHHQQQLPAQQQQQSNKNNVTMVDVIRGDAGGDVNNADIVEGGEQGPTISNLLNFDSEQLVHINSEEQQMIRLTSDELRLSNLSISS